MAHTGCAVSDQSSHTIVRLHLHLLLPGPLAGPNTSIHTRLSQQPAAPTLVLIQKPTSLSLEHFNLGILPIHQNSSRFNLYRFLILEQPLTNPGIDTLQCRADFVSEQSWLPASKQIWQLYHGRVEQPELIPNTHVQGKFCQKQFTTAAQILFVWRGLSGYIPGSRRVLCEQQILRTAIAEHNPVSRNAGPNAEQNCRQCVSVSEGVQGRFSLPGQLHCWSNLHSIKVHSEHHQK